MKIKDVFKKLCNFLCILFFIALFIGLAGNISSKFDKVYDLIKFKSYVILSDSMKQQWIQVMLSLLRKLMLII